jgi:cystathionine gamma-synthase
MTQYRPETLALHAGRHSTDLGDPVSPPIVTASSFHAHPDAVGFSAQDMNDDTPHFYTRWGNPTVGLLEERLAALEGGAGAVAFASGMGAISGLFFSQLRAGDHLVMSDVCYAGAAELGREILPQYGIEVSSVDTSDVANVARALRPGKTRLVHIETPANPILQVSDIAAIADSAHQVDARVSVDSTIATPVGTNPIALGADFVIHSLTKYVCGHGDALGGAIVVKEKALIQKMRQDALIHHGAVISPFAAWLMLRGLETLPLRMEVHESNARRLAEYLQRHSLVGRVNWPGLAQHPQAALAARQMRNFSGVLSFTVKSDPLAVARRIAERIRVFSYAVSLGKSKSLIFYIPTDDIVRTSFNMSIEQEERYSEFAGVGVLRVSAGLEHVDDLLADLEQALG